MQINYIYLEYVLHILKYLVINSRVNEYLDLALSIY